MKTMVMYLEVKQDDNNKDVPLRVSHIRIAPVVGAKVIEVHVELPDDFWATPVYEAKPMVDTSTDEAVDHLRRTAEQLGS